MNFSLRTEQIENLCILAEESARKYISSKISKSEVLDLIISVEYKEVEEPTFEVEVELTLLEPHTESEAKNLANEAVTSAFKVIDDYMANIKCQFMT